jgi:putative membrane protein
MEDGYRGIDGFLGTRASLMLDVVAVAMVGVLAVLSVSIYLVRYRGRFALHKRLQLALTMALVIVVALFEADMRMNGWRQRAEASPFYETWVMPVLSTHLVFSISTSVLWIGVTAAALRKFERPPRPGMHSVRHRFWGRLAAIDMVGTALTGWLFYWLAFAA